MATCKSDTPCYNVIDFVAGEITIDEESELAIADGVELIAQPMQLRRCKWQHVTVTQRSATKSSIMAHAIRDGLSVLWGFSSTALSTHWVPTTRKWFDFFHISWWTPWDSIVWIGPVKELWLISKYDISKFVVRCKKKQGGANVPMKMSSWEFHNSGIICLNGLPSTADISSELYELT